MKKRLVLIVLLSFIIFSITPAAVPGKITIWASEAQVQQLKDFVKGFTAKYGIQVEVNEVSFSDIKPKFITSAPTGEGPDIIVGAHDWIGELVANGLLLPIDFLPNNVLSQFTPVTLQAMSYKGKLYGIPYSQEAVALIYNKNLVPTPPTTYESLVRVAKKLTKGGTYGFLYDYNNFYYSFAFFSALGGYVFKETPQGLDPLDIGLANEGSIKGAQKLVDLFKEGILKQGIDYQTTTSLFSEGKLGMMITGPWEIDNIKRAKINYGVAKLPKIDGKPMRPFVGVQGFMLNSRSPNIAILKTFALEALATKEIELKLFEKDPRILARKDAYKVVSSNPDIKTFGASAADGIPMPNIPEMGPVWSSMGDALTLITSGKKTPDIALKEAVAQIKDAIQKARK
ncbi:MAG TPA: maltose/maltodextrin ABC transporter substrate-binding protein MalE [Dictyoglomaceae bacterium]|nr:maltose/maltodextrin ABC transporter substrate-binding protein MalE [Dictyoglomaceae bacterium]HOL39039.1 maltose/maltodextrin ABC transporter substrate-binding protein MalE [Dictyoglomaceae bacterium]HOP94378.1 maltose/maltodextrin ABC transporter substrate-binding protein MalE [Dictyoglomaceae bacterium]HPP15785.1 maltose/maltodextrin ABC transporter substrate-binding protein MalE [Dictyoglomaceae bacterium]HPU42774.1 maltose/maltodextrin ABC transporter substrate-binding protein MalE [Dic